MDATKRPGHGFDGCGATSRLVKPVEQAIAAQSGHFTPNLANVAQLTGWPTPMADDYLRSRESVESTDNDWKDLNGGRYVTGWN